MSQLSYLATLTQFIEAQWENRSQRCQALSELSQALSNLSSSLGQTQVHLKKLLPGLTKEINPAHFAGVVASIERFAQSAQGNNSVISYRDKPERTVFPLRLVLENIRSAHNVGSMIRSAEAFGFECVHLCGYTPTPENAQTQKASQGSHAMIEWSWENRAEVAIQKLKEKGFSLYALETDPGAPSLGDMEFGERVAVVLGNERFGLSRRVLEACDQTIQIPLWGRKNSLNVANAFSVVAYELAGRFKRRSPKGKCSMGSSLSEGSSEITPNSPV